MNLHAILVAYNEGERYLDAVLAQLPTASIHLYDDRSDDNTVGIAKSHGAVVTVRPRGTCSFLEHEGLFRQSAWQAFESALHPTAGDWVLAIDCDEFLVAPGGVASTLYQSIEDADAMMARSVNLAIPEVWELRADGPHKRVDGFWGGLSARRLFRYQTAGRFDHRSMGCGSTPTYVAFGHPIETELALAHYGYAELADRRVKYQRYMDLPVHGHNPAHVHSILTTPVVVPLGYPAPDVWTGVR